MESHRAKPISVNEEKDTKDESDNTQENKRSKDNKRSTNNKSEKTPTSKSSNIAEASEACDVKGSENSIYHTPGSTYYSRTQMSWNGFAPQ